VELASSDSRKVAGLSCAPNARATAGERHERIDAPERDLEIDVGDDLSQTLDSQFLGVPGAAAL
jgi:hypothetical protein